MKTKVAWMPKAQWPVEIGYISNEKVFKKEMKDLDVELTFTEYGTALHIQNKETLEQRIYVCINRENVGKDRIDAWGTLVHEAVHAKQYIEKIIQEAKMADETEAYTVGWIAEWLFKQWEDEK